MNNFSEVKNWDNCSTVCNSANYTIIFIYGHLEYGDHSEQ